MKLQDSVTIVTGGASGLGKATAERFARAGGKVVAFDLNEKAGQAFAAAMGERGLFCKVDVADEASVQAGITATTERFGAVHALVNCAGIANAHKTVGKKGVFPLAEFNKVIQVNLVGTFNVIRLAAEQMAKNEPVNGERGAIVNIASVAAFEGQMGQAAYSASKGGIVGMTLPVARDLASIGVRVNTIAPGLFLTPMMAGMPEEVRDSLAAQPLFPKRLGDPDEIAHMAQTLVENQYMNGETVRVDGGIRMQAR